MAATIPERSARAASLVVLVALVLGGCGAIGGPAPDIPYDVGRPYVVKGKRYVPRAEPNYRKTGIASWYGAQFFGRRTASGRRFNMFAMTAAHRTLPFGTKVRVTNLANRRAVVVTINDRGPFARSRLIDLSYGAAERLGFRHAGTARVRVEAVGPYRHRHARAADPSPGSSHRHYNHLPRAKPAISASSAR